MRRETLFALLVLPILGACQQKMATQGRVTPFSESSVFIDGRSTRAPVPGTVARGQLTAPPASATPLKATLPTLRRGKERFEIYCAACHGLSGYGDGMIVQRGFAAPPSFHLQRLHDSPDSHFYQVITNGYGAMFSYADRVSPSERWEIIAYIRALQLSQGIEVSRLSDSERKQLPQEGGEP